MFIVPYQGLPPAETALLGMRMWVEKGEHMLLPYSPAAAKNEQQPANFLSFWRPYSLLRLRFIDPEKEGIMYPPVHLSYY